MDNFFVTLLLRGRTAADRSAATVDVPKIEMNGSARLPHEAAGVLTDKDMHDVTAYLATLK